MGSSVAGAEGQMLGTIEDLTGVGNTRQKIRI
jgi:hypothetical protein